MKNVAAAVADSLRRLTGCLIMPFFHFAITSSTDNPVLARQCVRTILPLHCLSCTTRRNECTPRSRNLRLSWPLLCGLCMIFYHVDEFRKHGLQELPCEMANVHPRLSAVLLITALSCQRETFQESESLCNTQDYILYNYLATIYIKFRCEQYFYCFTCNDIYISEKTETKFYG